MTEDEARTKWCPFARCHDCIASECMAWRETRAETPHIAAHPGISAEQFGHAADGYCGLAGRPD